MKLLALSGSLRKASRNTLLMHEAVRLGPFDDVAYADIRMPLYDGDLEEAVGLPPEVIALNDQIRAADALVIATPEYNKMIPGVLKNALDWVSRDKPQPLMGKPIAILSAAGRSGGETSQFTLRHALTTFNVRLVGGSGVMIPNGGTAFGEDGQLVDPAQVEAVSAMMSRLSDLAKS